jgi:tetratricopeptide (TPR) repeat protein
LEAICLKAMSKDAADRYATAADFAADLRIYLDDRMPTAVTSRIGASRLTSRHVIFACVGLVVAILCSPLMWSNWNNLRGVETPSSSALRNSDSAPILNAATLRRQFDAILQDRFKHRGYITKSPNISARYRDTFASLGIWPGEIEALEFWHFLNKADVEARAEFLIALQAWRSCTTREQEDVPVAWLNAILAAHDSRHAHIRDAVSKQNEQVGRYVDAYDAIGEDPRYAVIWSDYLRGPDSKLAIELLTKVHRAHPNSLLVETALGIRYRQDRSYQKAMERLESALAMEKSAVLWTNLAICQIRTKQFDEAICAARKAIHLDSEYGIAYHFLGRALLAEGRYAEADDAFRTAIEKDTGSPGDTHRHHAHALAKLNRAEDAHLARLRAIPYMQANRRWSVVLNFTTASLDHLAEAQPDNFDERFRLALIAQQASSKVNRVYQSRKRIQTLLQDLKAQAPTSQARIQRLEKIVQASNGKRDKKR